jgi:hypothetical protein
MVTAQRPVGITILAVIAFIFGSVGILGALSMLSGAAVLRAGDGNIGGLLLVYGLILLIAAGLQIAFGAGALSLKPWAWTLGVAVQVVSMVLALLYVLLGANAGGQLLSIVPAAIILVYLFTPGVRRAFGKA